MIVQIIPDGVGNYSDTSNLIEIFHSLLVCAESNYRDTEKSTRSLSPEYYLQEVYCFLGQLTLTK